MAFLVCENIEYLYSIGTPFQTAALDDVSLEIEQGDLIGIIGEQPPYRHRQRRTRAYRQTVRRR